MHDQLVIAIIAGIFGSGILSTLVAWLLERVDSHNNAPTAADLAEVNEKLRNDYVMLEKSKNEHDEFRAEIRQLRIERMRGELFAQVRSKDQHEHLIDMGREYLELGGNGAGHLQLERLEDDYTRRLSSGDWDYTHNRP